MDATFKVPIGIWLGARQKKSAFGIKKNAPGLKAEHESALFDDQARTDYLAQVAKDEEKSNGQRKFSSGIEDATAQS